MAPVQRIIEAGALGLRNAVTEHGAPNKISTSQLAHHYAPAPLRAIEVGRYANEICRRFNHDNPGMLASSHRHGELTGDGVRLGPLHFHIEMVN